VNRIATPICLLVGIVAGLVIYAFSQSWLAAGVSWVVVSGLAVLAFDVRTARHPACRAAVDAVRSIHPDWDVWTALASIRADEDDRYVVAVFYSDPNVRVKPPRYLLVALDRALQFIEKLPVSPDSPYFISGRK
jgi:hypothetical protein